MKLDEIIENLSKYENTTTDNFKKYIKSFEKYIKHEINKYDDKSGLEDAKLSKLDYDILYELYINTKNSEYKLYILYICAGVLDD